MNSKKRRGLFWWLFTITIGMSGFGLAGLLVGMAVFPDSNLLGGLALIFTQTNDAFAACASLCCVMVRPPKARECCCGQANRFKQCWLRWRSTSVRELSVR